MSLLTFLSEANGYCNPPFEQLGTMTSLIDIDSEMNNFKVSNYNPLLVDSRGSSLVLFIQKLFISLVHLYHALHDNFILCFM